MNFVNCKLHRIKKLLKRNPFCFFADFRNLSRSSVLTAGLAASLFFGKDVQAQSGQVQDLWHGKPRKIHYRPDGQDFVLVEGRDRFNRALYGTNTAFRVETGDLPEFALYMPGMGGNLKFGLISGNTSKWLIDAASIETRYRPGAMHYTIKDELLGGGVIRLEVLALSDAEGLIVKAEASGVKNDVQLLWAFGGASGKKFSRSGDIGADPESSFYLLPEYCRDNIYILNKNSFRLLYGSGKTFTEQERREIQLNPEKAKAAAALPKQQELQGVFPAGAAYKIADAGSQANPLSFYNSKPASYPVLTGTAPLKSSDKLYFLVKKPDQQPALSYTDLPSTFNKAEQARLALVSRVVVETPDPFINTLGGALTAAADGVWESPTFLHGAVAWRMRLNAWRGAAIADVLSWHDRAREHFTSYSNSQVISPLTGPVVADTALNLTRQKEVMGTSMFSSGYISRNPNDNTRPHHYDMNLVFFDQMFTHFKWTGDTAFLRKMWPVLVRHMNWEKRNFDADGDGLYDAYAAIWASDALQYSGGGVTHTSAYNYRANREMAKLAELIGEDPGPYKKEAEHILNAVQKKLWMPGKGWYAEYKDLLGNKLLHPQAGLWTIYHAVDAGIPDPFQAYQALQYVSNEIPHIPVKAEGLPDKGYYTLSTTNWHPYTWSVNNVALAEVLHTSLAYWQAGRIEDAFKLWESSLIESMYLGKSPGNFHQLSFYDAMRGELYRDFADPIATAGRSLVEGLYGIHPDLLNKQLLIRPGLPQSWDHAYLSLPDISFRYKRSQNHETYTITPAFSKKLELVMELQAKTSRLRSVKVNGQPVSWKLKENSIGRPVIQVQAPASASYTVELDWEGNEFSTPKLPGEYAVADKISIAKGEAAVLTFFDPQQVLKNSRVADGSFTAEFNNKTGGSTFFVQLQQGNFTWWHPVNVRLKPSLFIQAPLNQPSDGISFTIVNAGKGISGELLVNNGKKQYRQKIELGADSEKNISVASRYLIPGSNTVRILSGKKLLLDTLVQNWNVPADNLSRMETVNLSSRYNEDLNRIFQNRYLSPRPSSTTLQIPAQGIGNWCYPLINPDIDDSGLRKAAGADNRIVFKDKIPFSTPGEQGGKNILFTSKWDNFPDSVSIPVTGKASHAYFLMAGSTNHMQSRFDNAEIRVNYQDGTSSVLKIRNPENWWPIEQDYYIDDYAFAINAVKPPRLYLKQGRVIDDFKQYKTIQGYTSYAVDGGAAQILDLPLDSSKKLKNITLKTIANEVIVGLMSVTLER